MGWRQLPHLHMFDCLSMVAFSFCSWTRGQRQHSEGLTDSVICSGFVITVIIACAAQIPGVSSQRFLGQTPFWARSSRVCWLFRAHGAWPVPQTRLLALVMQGSACSPPGGTSFAAPWRYQPSSSSSGGPCFLVLHPSSQRPGDFSAGSCPAAGWTYSLRG